MTYLKALFAYDKVYCFLDNRALFVIILRYIVSLFVMLYYFISADTKDIDVVISNKFVDFNVSTVICSKSYCSI